MYITNRSAGVSVVAFAYSAGVNLGWVVVGIIVASFSTWVSSLIYALAALGIVALKIYMEQSFSAGEQTILDSLKNGILWTEQFHRVVIRPNHELYILRRDASKFGLENEAKKDENRYVYFNRNTETTCVMLPRCARQVLRSLHVSDSTVPPPTHTTATTSTTSTYNTAESSKDEDNREPTTLSSRPYWTSKELKAMCRAHSRPNPCRTFCRRILRT